MRDMMHNCELLELRSWNKLTKEEGIAIFYSDNKTIKVFERDGSGCDDKEIDYDKFIDNYNYRLVHELNEDVDIDIKIQEEEKIEKQINTDVSLVYLYSEALAWELSRTLGEGEQICIDTKAVLDYIKARVTPETLIDEVLEATILLLKNKYSICINNDNNINLIKFKTAKMIILERFGMTMDKRIEV